MSIAICVLGVNNLKADVVVLWKCKEETVKGVNIVDFFNDDTATDINSYDKSIAEKVKLLEQLDDTQRKSIFTFIDTAISNKRLKDTLNNALNLAH